MDKRVQIIKPINSILLPSLSIKKRVCAYCRVSTDHAHQTKSYNAQVQYYENKISINSQYEFVGIYADESTGTSKKNRNQFNQMIEDCKNKKIDLILTKSITRFARNTVDSIQTVRELTALGIEVIFEKENISTLNQTSEIMLSILSSIAQSESQNISENIRWGIRKRFENGTFSLHSVAYGYKKDANGNLIINDEEAKVVKEIFEMYLSGYGMNYIANHLTASTNKTSKNNDKWSESTISRIITNTIYVGDLLLQKTYSANSFPYQRKKNLGQKQMYEVKDNHDLIIERKTFELAKNIMLNNSKCNGTYFKKYSNETYIFTSKIICNNCGSTFKRKITYKDKQIDKILWVCKKHIASVKDCENKAISETQIQREFIEVWNRLVANYDNVLIPLLTALSKANQIAIYSDEVIKIDNNIEELKQQKQYLMHVMQKGNLTSAVFISKQNELDYKIDHLKLKRKLFLQEGKYTNQITQTKRLLQIINYNSELFFDFDDALFENTVKIVVINSNHQIVFEFINGIKLHI